MAVLDIGDNVRIGSEYVTSAEWQENLQAHLDPKGLEPKVQGMVVLYQRENGKFAELRVPCDRSVFDKFCDEWRAAAP